MRVLGIETSCDETAVAIVEADSADRPVGRLLANVVYSQLTEHRRFGGVVPEIAARAHLERIDGLVEQALAEAGLGLGDLDGIAATGGPGLIGGVMVGVMTAKAIAFAHDKPFLAINHLEGHALVGAAHRAGRVSLSAAADVGRPLPAPDGARAGRLHAARHDDRRRGRRMLRQDRQAAGPRLSRRAGGRARGEGRRHAVASSCRGRCGASPAATSPSPASRPRCARWPRSLPKDDPQAIADLCASFQRTVGDVLVDRCSNALALAPSDTLVVAGGVAANTYLRGRLEGLGRSPRRAADQVLHRQRRDDRLGGDRAAAARHGRCARLRAAPALAAWRPPEERGHE